VKVQLNAEAGDALAEAILGMIAVAIRGRPVARTRIHIKCKNRGSLIAQETAIQVVT
jgi:hypothetical protein